MLLGMEWMTRENPKICFKPLSMKVQGHELTAVSTPHSYCDEHGYNCDSNNGNHGLDVGRTRPPGRGRPREEILRDLLEALRTDGGGLGRGCGVGHGDWRPHNFGGHPVPVFRHAKMADAVHAPCQSNISPGAKAEKKWIDWRDLFPDRSWYNPHSDVLSQGSTISRGLTMKTTTKHDKVPDKAAGNNVIEWLSKTDHDPATTDSHEGCRPNKVAIDTASRYHQVESRPKRSHDRSCTGPTNKPTSSESRVKLHSVVQDDRCSTKVYKFRA